MKRTAPTRAEKRERARRDRCSSAHTMQPPPGISLRVYGDVTLEDEATGMKTKYRAELGPEVLTLYAVEGAAGASMASRYLICFKQREY